MSPLVIIVVIVLFLILVGGGYSGYHQGWYGGPTGFNRVYGGGIGLGSIIVVLLILWLLGVF